jgi:sugar phosphate isomerase/epimerase
LASLKLPFKQALHTASRLGADAVEIDARGEVPVNDLSQSAVRHLRKMLEDRNLRVAALGFPTRRPLYAEEELDRRLDALRHTLHAAYRLGTRTVVTSLGDLPPPEETKKWDLLRELLLDLGRYAEHVGALLAAETGLDDGRQLHQLLSRLPEGTLWIAFNPGALLVHGFDPKSALSLLGPFVQYVYATDGVREPSLVRGVSVPFGRGTANFPELLALLEEHRYAGYFTVRRDEAENPERELASAVQYLRNLVE